MAQKGLYSFEFLVEDLTLGVAKPLQSKEEGIYTHNAELEIKYINAVISEFFDAFGKATVDNLYKNTNVNKKSVTVIGYKDTQSIYVEYKVYYKTYRELCTLQRIFLNNKEIWKRRK